MSKNVAEIIEYLFETIDFLGSQLDFKNGVIDAETFKKIEEEYFKRKQFSIEELRKLGKAAAPFMKYYLEVMTAEDEDENN